MREVLNESGIDQKLNIKEEQNVLLINCPEELEADFDGLSLEKILRLKKLTIQL